MIIIVVMLGKHFKIDFVYEFKLIILSNDIVFIIKYLKKKGV